MTSVIDQCRVVAFLRDPASWPDRTDEVQMIETHGACVFLAGELAIKIKRDVRFDYMDFSSIEARRRFLVRELELNAPHAAGLYRDVVAIVQTGDGRLQVGGEGEPVEWALRMHRFDQDQLMSALAARHALTPTQLDALADTLVAYHGDAAPGTRDRAPDTARSLIAPLSTYPDPGVRAVVEHLRAALDSALATTTPLRRARAQAGFIRRCHGDLHMRNVVLWRGRLVPFDALEFDEDMATVDILHDFAFLLMDLDRNGAREEANRLFNRYLWRSGRADDLTGLAALPLFLALRATVRARVAADRATTTGVGDGTAHIVDTLAYATACLSPPSPRLIAVGGLSGTGKTTLARALAPTIGAAPGAVHLRTDLERKWLAGVDDLDRLPAGAYAAEGSEQTYARVLERARLTLAAGHSVIVDGVFEDRSERLLIERIARWAGLPFRGLWLYASPRVMTDRVAHRTQDASDATVDVVARQLARAEPAYDWTRIEADSDAATVLERARAALAGA